MTGTKRSRRLNNILGFMGIQGSHKLAEAWVAPIQYIRKTYGLAIALEIVYLQGLVSSKYLVFRYNQ
jgi:hypothetical protein